jgi:hypothetical protein
MNVKKLHTLASGDAGAKRSRFRGASAGTNEIGSMAVQTWIMAI